MRLALVGPRRQGPRAGGIERYTQWLETAWAARLDAQGLRFATRARWGGEVVRLGDGVSWAWWRAMGGGAWRRWRHRALFEAEARAIAEARALIVIAPFLAAQVAEWQGRSDAHVLLNPLLHPPLAREEPEVDLLFVGHGFERKGLDFLLSALSGLPQRTLTVVGHDRRLRAWRRWAAPLGARVRFVGAEPAAPWLARARLLVHPARYEPYGNVVAEAVGCGLPAVVSAATGASCLLHADHVWPEAQGIEGLRARIEAALHRPQPVRLRPPSAEAHLRALEAILWPSAPTL